MSCTSGASWDRHITYPRRHLHPFMKVEGGGSVCMQLGGDRHHQKTSQRMTTVRKQSTGIGEAYHSRTMLDPLGRQVSGLKTTQRRSSFPGRYRDCGWNIFRLDDKHCLSFTPTYLQPLMKVHQNAFIFNKVGLFELSWLKTTISSCKLWHFVYWKGMLALHTFITSHINQGSLF